MGAGQLARDGDRLHARTSSTGTSSSPTSSGARALWLYTLFFHGEDSVTDNLSPYIDAAPLEEQKYFLTTQQVDEARHSVFFKRFMHEVVGAGDGTMAGGLRATAGRDHVGPPPGLQPPGPDGRRAARATARSPSSPRRSRSTTSSSRPRSPSPGQHMIEASLEELDVLPGFREGMRNVSLDEQRHIGFGVKLLADLYREDPGPIQDAIVGAHQARSCRGRRRWPSRRTGTAPTPSASASRSRTWARRARPRSSSACARSACRSTPSRGFPMPMDLPPRERAVRGQKLLRAGPHRPRRRRRRPGPRGDRDHVRHDPPRGRSPTACGPGTTIEWDFADAEPWHVVLDNGGSRAACRAARPHADLDAAPALRRLGRRHGRPRRPAGADAQRRRCGRRAARGCCWRCRRSSGSRLSRAVRGGLKQHHRGKGVGAGHRRELSGITPGFRH